MRPLSIITITLRTLGILSVCVGLIFRILHWPNANLLIAVGGSLVVVALLLNLINGGWEMSTSDEKVRLTGHLCILYGFATFLAWLPRLPLGPQAIISGVLLLVLAYILKRRRLKAEQDPAARIDEIGKEPPAPDQD